MNNIKKNKHIKGLKQINSKSVTILLCLVFLVGVILGVIYLKHNINLLKFENNIFEKDGIKTFENSEEIFEKILYQNVTSFLLFWIVGLSILGIPLLVLKIFFEGISIGITSTYVLLNLGFYKGYLFIYISMYINTMISIFSMILMTLSAIKVTYNFLKNNTNVKSEIGRHSIFCFLVLIILIIASFLEINLAEIGKNVLAGK